MKRYIVNEEGEVEQELREDARYVEINRGDRVVRSKSIKAYKDREVETKKLEFRFVKVNVHWIDEVSEKCPLFTILLKYIHYGDNMLLYDNGKPLNATNLCRTNKLSYATCRRQLETLVKRDVIRKVKTKDGYVYYFNPFVAYCGKWVLMETIDMFNGSKYREGVKVE